MTRRERAQTKRRKAAEARALDYLKAALAELPGRRKGTAEKRIRESVQPMSTARAIVQEWRNAYLLGNVGIQKDAGLLRNVQVQTVPDLSAATEARAAILRRQPPCTRRRPAFDDELRELERALLTGRVSQRVFETRCEKIAGRPLPGWMASQDSEIGNERRA